MRFSDKIRGTSGENPFSDSQARNFSDRKVFQEFYPISLFWTLFNDQHEVLLGTRGSGKTFLLKMMRYSMLKHIDNDRARKLVSEKKYIAIYVPMHLEFVLPFNNEILDENQRIRLFQIAFNCYLSEALLVELESIVEDIEDTKKRVETQVKLITALGELWFGNKVELYEFYELMNEVRKVYYNIDWNNALTENTPIIFQRQICSPLVAAQKIINKALDLGEEPTWIVCVDEAEFLNLSLQKCLNGIFRSDSGRIALKVATLPFHHNTLQTLDDNITVSNGNDFSYRIVDMPFDGDDFIGLTNNLCQHRLYERFTKESICESVEAFVGMVGKEEYIDYYRFEVKEKASPEIIESEIIASLPPKRKQNARNYSNIKKTIYNKYAPIYYLREMKKLSEKGNNKPGWYAGAKNIRRVAQGNPRLFIQVMNALFEKAKKTVLKPKTQHEVIYNFAKTICESTKALEVDGPRAYKNLNYIAQELSDKVHGQYLNTGGTNFTLKYTKGCSLQDNIHWLKLSVAYSRLIVDEKTKTTGITSGTKFDICNAFAIVHWIPMRNDDNLTITLSEEVDNMYSVKTSRRKRPVEKETYHQMSLFEEKNNEENS